MSEHVPRRTKGVYPETEEEFLAKLRELVAAYPGGSGRKARREALRLTLAAAKDTPEPHP